MTIRDFRKKYNLSREDLASKLGVSFMSIYRWEKGLIKRPNKAIQNQLKKIMKIYANKDF